MEYISENPCRHTLLRQNITSWVQLFAPQTNHHPQNWTQPHLTSAESKPLWKLLPGPLNLYSDCLEWSVKPLLDKKIVFHTPTAIKICAGVTREHHVCQLHYRVGIHLSLRNASIFHLSGGCMNENQPHEYQDTIEMRVKPVIWDKCSTQRNGEQKLDIFPPEVTSPIRTNLPWLFSQAFWHRHFTLWQEGFW